MLELEYTKRQYDLTSSLIFVKQVATCFLLDIMSFRLWVLLESPENVEYYFVLF